MTALPDPAPFRKRLEELDLQAQSPDFFSDRRRSAERLREMREVRALVDAGEAHAAAVRAVGETRALAEDGGAEAELRELAAAEVPELERREAEARAAYLLALAPPEPHDERSTILEVRAGTGGDEASLFAAELLRAYQRYIEGRGWKASVLSVSGTDAGGIREAIVEVAGAGAYGELKHESGVHRVQRVPVTEANGRIHTSTVTVAVLPEAEEVELELDPAELEITVSRASGPGGQGVNTTDSAVQVLHRPTGMIVTCADGRSQQKNKAQALAVLRARLLRLREDEERAKTAEARRSQIGGGERSDKVRTYNFPQNRVTDHRTGLTVHDLPAVMEGKFDALVSALREAERAERLERALAGRA